MKILIFIPHMGLGGVERSFINLSKEFKNKGHNVKFVSLNDIKSTYNEDIELIKLNSTRTVFSISKLSKTFNIDRGLICIKNLHIYVDNDPQSSFQLPVIF